MTPPSIPDLSEFLFSRNFIIIYVIILVLCIVRSYAVGYTYVSGNDRLDDKCVIITGAFSGIGKATAINLARLGARVIITGRNMKFRESDIAFIKEKCPPNSVSAMELDVSDFDSIIKFVRRFKKNVGNVDILVNNAGIMCHPEAKSAQGFELHFATHFLGPVLLMRALVDSFNPQSRIINVVSSAMSLGPIDPEDIENSRPEYNSGNSFSRSKLALAMYSIKLSEEIDADRLTVNCVHPGIVMTGIHRHMVFRKNWFIKISSYPVCLLLMKYSNNVAETMAMLAASPEFAEKTGVYVSGSSVDEFPEEAKNYPSRKAVCEYADNIIKEYLDQLN